MCKHCFGVQLFQNPPLYSSSHFTERWLCKHGGVKVSSFSWLSSRYGSSWHVTLGKKCLFRYFLPLFVTSLPLLVSNDNVLESTSNNVTSNDLVSYIYSLGNSLRPAETVTKGNDVTLLLVWCEVLSAMDKESAPVLPTMLKKFSAVLATQIIGCNGGIFINDHD